MYLRNGYLVIKRSGAPPIMIHWTVAALAIIISGFRFQPGAWLGFFVIILVHELGHAVAVWKARAMVSAIVMDGTGGHCEWEATSRATSDWLLSGAVFSPSFFFGRS